MARICEVVHNRDTQGRALNLTIYGLGRRIRFASQHQVPAFDGDLAWFEVEPKPKTHLGVRFVRQVEKPPQKVHRSR